jgi:hypothetical protein
MVSQPQSRPILAKGSIAPDGGFLLLGSPQRPKRGPTLMSFL